MPTRGREQCITTAGCLTIAVCFGDGHVKSPDMTTGTPVLAYMATKSDEVMWPGEAY